MNSIQLVKLFWTANKIIQNSSHNNMLGIKPASIWTIKLKQKSRFILLLNLNIHSK